MKNPIYSGWHLTIDAFVRNPNLLADAEHLKSMMRELVDVLKMEILVEPNVVEVALNETNLKNDSDDGGITGFCVITTSHISIHTWPLRKRFSMDVFSCKSFDCEEAMAFIREKLDIEQESIIWLERTWPQDETEECLQKQTA